MKKRPLGLWGAVLAAGALTFIAPRIFADLVKEVYSPNSASSIGSWSDELWQAKSFYVANPCPSGPAQYCYKYSAYPLGSGPYADIFVTEWQTTGHVHFQTGP